jgi:DNA gyrase inhibitor GyrI
MPEVKHYPKMHVAYVSAVGPYDGEAIQRGFGRLFAWLGSKHFAPLGPTIGIYYDDPQTVAREKQRCDLCVTVGPEVKGSDGVLVKDIGDVDVAALTYLGTQNIQRTYTELHNWLHTNGYYETGTPLELYLSQPGQELRAEVAMPVEKVLQPAKV